MTGAVVCYGQGGMGGGKSYGSSMWALRQYGSESLVLDRPHGSALIGCHTADRL